MRIFLAHGFKGHPGCPRWYPWLKKKLEKEGHSVFCPRFPKPGKPVVREWIKTIEQTLRGDFHGVIFVGHSLGGNAVLRALGQHKNGKEMAKAVILVGTPQEYKTRPEEIRKFISAAYPWTRIKKRAWKFFHFSSTNDRAVLPSEVKAIHKKLGGKLFQMPNMGHFEKAAKFPEILYLFEQVLYSKKRS